MRSLWVPLIVELTMPLLVGQSALNPVAHDPLKVHCDAKPATIGKVSLTCEFELNPKYDINLVPKPKVDVVAGKTSVLPAQIVPTNLHKGHDPRYYGAMAPVSATVDRRPGLQAQVTYFFCSKKDGFCARKIDKVDIQLP